MCNCAPEVEAKAKEKIATQLPDGAQSLTVELQGMAMILGKTLETKNKLNLHVEYQASKRGGGFKTVKQDLSMIGSYCMFCGEKYPEVA